MQDDSTHGCLSVCLPLSLLIHVPTCLSAYLSTYLPSFSGLASTPGWRVNPKVSIAIRNRQILTFCRNNMFGAARGWGPEDRSVIDTEIPRPKDIEGPNQNIPCYYCLFRFRDTAVLHTNLLHVHGFDSIRILLNKGVNCKQT